MHSINKEEVILPELISTEEYIKKPPKEREEYSKSRMVEIVNLNTRKGITISQIERNTYFHRNTISKHIKNLISQGILYQYPPNERNGLLFSNGNLLDPLFEDTIQLKNKFFKLFIIENRLGKFIYLQEKKETIYGEFETKGGLIIPLDEAMEFVDSFNSIINKLRKRKIIR